MNRLVPQRVPRPGTVQPAHLPAMVGGVNAVDPATAMPELDCVYAYNVIPGPLGLRTRLGYEEWLTGPLLGALDFEVRSVVPFTGSMAAKSRLFVATSTGIYDATNSAAVSSAPASPWVTATVVAGGARVTSSGNVYITTDGGTTGAVPPSGTSDNVFDGGVVWHYEGVYLPPALTFADNSGDAGRGVHHVTVTSAGHFLLYCDEVNGLFVYTESTDTWTQPTMGGGAGQIANVDPADLVHVNVFKNRVWFVERDSARAWYLDTGLIYGSAHRFDLGTKFRAGGYLVCTGNWTYDGGGGIDDALVLVSSGGDVAIYQGTDPSDATAFGMKGVWQVAGVPSGRRILTESGGELLLLTILGLLPLSKLVVGGDIADTKLYATWKVTPLFNGLVSLYQSLPGWSVIVHPTDNALLVTYPTASGEPTNQLAMSFASRGWFQYRDLPIMSAAVWNSILYFGTADGRVCRNTGFVDNVPLDASSYEAVDWSVLPAFRNGGRPTFKRGQEAQLSLVSSTPSPAVGVTARYDFNTDEPASPSGLPALAPGTWGSAVWGTSDWAGANAASIRRFGLAGEGRAMSLAIRGSANCATTLVGVDLLFEEGGF